jgi:hypothetical protein
VTGAIVGTGEVAVLVVGVGKLFAVAQPGFSFDAVEVVSGGAVVEISG